MSADGVDSEVAATVMGELDELDGEDEPQALSVNVTNERAAKLCFLRMFPPVRPSPDACRLIKHLTEGPFINHPTFVGDSGEIGYYTPIQLVSWG